MDLADHFRTSARANRLANYRLQQAMLCLGSEDFHARRVSFFPSLAATVNHLLAVDVYYTACLHGEADMVLQYQQFRPCANVTAWARRQKLNDERLIALCDGLAMDDLERPVRLDRGDRVDLNPLGRTLAHLFMHQTHHRGQVHAMLSGTSIKPPQLDDFLLPSDARVRTEDVQALGWTEIDLFGEHSQAA
ncbi:DinB family protein [Ideonella sp.]|uniref:DinB family protein n=1 Tax=Ideonella sp. TaxID=1929293 RepID=UPI00351AF752